MNLRQVAAEYGLSFWTARTWVLNGHLPRVSLPSKTGGTLRRVLVDRLDVEALIERSKEPRSGLGPKASAGRELKRGRQMAVLSKHLA
jgi:predicted site-specific integrase-resolvase